MDYADLAQQDLDIHGQLKGTGASRAGRSAWRGLRVAARWYREFLLGLGVVMVLTDAAKLLVAEPRPHFLDTCKPDAAINCSSPTQWIDDFVCTNQRLSWWNVRDSMRSFPSGHTSISVFTSLFMMFFLRRRLAPDVTFLLVPWLQGLFALWAAVCSFSRITDHRHHWWDVLAGSIVGVISAIYTVKMFCGNFSPSREPGEFGSDSGSIPKDQNQPLLNGTINRSAPERSTGLVDTVPARRLLSSSSSCASSLTTEERELREVSSP